MARFFKIIDGIVVQSQPYEEEGFIEGPDWVACGWVYDEGEFMPPPEPALPIPQEVTMGQCRLALFDLHAIKTEAQFFALVDLVPEDQRERAILQLKTRQTVRYDNELVMAICASKEWDAAALFIYAAKQ